MESREAPRKHTRHQCHLSPRVVMSADIGLVGLAVMGENLVLNMERNGFTVAVFNRTTARVDDFVNGRGKGLKVCFHSAIFTL